MFLKNFKLYPSKHLPLIAVQIGTFLQLEHLFLVIDVPLLVFLVGRRPNMELNSKTIILNYIEAGSNKSDNLTCNV